MLKNHGKYVKNIQSNYKFFKDLKVTNKLRFLLDSRGKVLVRKGEVDSFKRTLKNLKWQRSRRFLGKSLLVNINLNKRRLSRSLSFRNTWLQSRIKKDIFMSFYSKMKRSNFKTKLIAIFSNKKKQLQNHCLNFFERRLDSYVYRLKIFPTVYYVNQFIRHSGIQLNGKLTNQPGLLIKVGSIVEFPKNIWSFVYNFIYFKISQLTSRYFLNKNRKLMLLFLYLHVKRLNAKNLKKLKPKPLMKSSLKKTFQKYSFINIFVENSFINNFSFGSKFNMNSFVKYFLILNKQSVAFNFLKLKNILSYFFSFTTHKFRVFEGIFSTFLNFKYNSRVFKNINTYGKGLKNNFLIIKKNDLRDLEVVLTKFNVINFLRKNLSLMAFLLWEKEGFYGNFKKLFKEYYLHVFYITSMKSYLKSKSNKYLSTRFQVKKQHYSRKFITKIKVLKNLNVKWNFLNKKLKRLYRKTKKTKVHANRKTLFTFLSHLNQEFDFTTLRSFFYSKSMVNYLLYPHITKSNFKELLVSYRRKIF